MKRKLAACAAMQKAQEPLAERMRKADRVRIVAGAVGTISEVIGDLQRAAGATELAAFPVELVYVETPEEAPERIGAAPQARLVENVAKARATEAASRAMAAVASR